MSLLEQRLINQHLAEGTQLKSAAAVVRELVAVQSHCSAARRARAGKEVG
jgi:hypothetical protein